MAPFCPARPPAANEFGFCLELATSTWFNHMMLGEDLREAVVLLAAVGLVAWVAHRARLSIVLGFVVVGIIVGPYGLGRWDEHWPWLAAITVEKTNGLHLAAELGVAFLLFMIALEFSLERLWRMRALVFGLGGAQVLVTGAAIAAIASWAGAAPAVAVLIGGALALSSTAIVIQLLTEEGRLGTLTGRTAFAILLFQDLAVVPLLFMVGVLGANADAGLMEMAQGVALAIGKAALVIALIIAIGRLIARPVLRAVAETHSREAFLAAILLAIIGTAMATEAAGLSLALGAFLAGLLLAETEYRPQIAVDLEPFKGLLLGVFFVSVGIGLDPAQVLADAGSVLGAAAGLVLLKALVIYLLARLAREPRGAAVDVALLLAQGGEFAFIIIAAAAALGLVTAPVAAFIGLVAGLTMLATPALAWAGRKLAARLQPAAPVVETAPDALEVPGGHVIIAGYGRVGRAVGELLDTQRVPHLAIDRRTGRVARLRREGAAVFYGDAAKPEMLARLGADTAAALVITMDNAEQALEVTRTAHRTWPGLPIHARVRDTAHARALLEAGATHVVLETLEAGLQMGEALLVEVGVPDDTARALIAEQREAMRAGLAAHR